MKNRLSTKTPVGIWCGRDIVISITKLMAAWVRCDRCHMTSPDPSIHILYYVAHGAVRVDIAAFDRGTFDDVLCKRCFEELTTKEVVARLITAMMTGRE